jgi:hypothetical protein
MNDGVAEQLGCASENDYDCLCEGNKGSEMQALVKPCVISACGMWGAASIPATAEKLCECVRVEKGKSEL